MSEVSDLAGFEMFESKGKAYKLSHVSPAIRAAFTAWAKMRARQEIAERKPFMSRADYDDELAVFQRRSTAGDYNWGFPLDPKGIGIGAAELMSTDEGQARLAAVFLEEHHGQLDLEKAQAITAAGGAGYDAAIRAAMELPPNSSAPAETTGGTGTTTGDEKAPAA